MKRLFLLALILTIMNLDAATYVSNQPIRYTRKRLRTTDGRIPRYKRLRVRRDEEQQPGESLDEFCRQCCAQGRSVSRECCLKCNSCQAYSDEGASECRDYPF